MQGRELTVHDFLARGHQKDFDLPFFGGLPQHLKVPADLFDAVRQIPLGFVRDRLLQFRLGHIGELELAHDHRFASQRGDHSVAFDPGGGEETADRHAEHIGAGGGSIGNRALGGRGDAKAGNLTPVATRRFHLNRFKGMAPQIEPDRRPAPEQTHTLEPPSRWHEPLFAFPIPGPAIECEHPFAMVVRPRDVLAHAVGIGRAGSGSLVPHVCRKLYAAIPHRLDI